MKDLKPFEHGEEGTHTCCKPRLKKEGGKARCCYCVPHEGCEMKEKIKKVSKPGTIHFKPKNKEDWEGGLEEMAKLGSNPMTKDKQNWEEAVRDICSVPVTKSKTKRIISQLLKEERVRVIGDLDTNKIAEIQFNTEQEHHLNDGCHPTKCHHRKIDDLMKRLLKLLKE